MGRPREGEGGERGPGQEEGAPLEDLEAEGLLLDRPVLLWQGAPVGPAAAQGGGGRGWLRAHGDERVIPSSGSASRSLTALGDAGATGALHVHAQAPDWPGTVDR